MTSISNLGIQQILTSQLLSQQSTLAQLNEQLGTNKQHSNLTDYSPADAHNLMDFQNAVNQRQTYLASINTVQSRMSVYDSTMTDIEKIASQAQALTSQNTVLDTTKIASIAAQATTYLQQMGDDLNQQVSGRYIYGGTRYSSAPVRDLTTLSAITPPFTASTSPTLPDYSTAYSTANSFTINSTPTGNFKVGNSYVQWSDIAAGTVTNVYVNGVANPVTVTGLTSPATTPTQLADNLQKVITQTSGSIADFAGLTASASTNQVTFGYAGSLTGITPTTGASSNITWADGTDGTSTENMATTDAASFTQDTANIDNGYSLTYGVTSNDPAFQQVIAGLRLIRQASQTGVSAATYNTDMQQAGTLLTQGLAALRTIHSTVANNVSTLTNQTTLQNADINALQSQLDNVRSVDMTTVGTELSLLQTQLSASYSATASLEQLSILKYL